MILEVAELSIIEGTGTDFERAVEESAQYYIRRTRGYISHMLQRSIEDPTRYLLLIQWETLEAHTVNFRESDDFLEHRKLISPYFAKPPFVQHFQLCQ